MVDAFAGTCINCFFWIARASDDGVTVVLASDETEQSVSQIASIEQYCYGVCRRVLEFITTCVLGYNYQEALMS
jgi:hypothetical protein